MIITIIDSVRSEQLIKQDVYRIMLQGMHGEAGINDNYKDGV